MVHEWTMSGKQQIKEIRFIYYLSYSLLTSPPWLLPPLYPTPNIYTPTFNTSWTGEAHRLTIVHNSGKHNLETAGHGCAIKNIQQVETGSWMLFPRMGNLEDSRGSLELPAKSSGRKSGARRMNGFYEQNRCLQKVAWPDHLERILFKGTWVSELDVK